MGYRGHIENGTVVLDEPIELSEGSQVLIQPVSPSTTLAELFTGIAGEGKGLPDDGSIHHDHYISGTPK